MVLADGAPFQHIVQLLKADDAPAVLDGSRRNSRFQHIERGAGVPFRRLANAL